MEKIIKQKEGISEMIKLREEALNQTKIKSKY